MDDNTEVSSLQRQALLKEKESPFSLPLRTGGQIPIMGLGLYKMSKASMKTLIPAAIKIGYRCFDTASFYGNEKELGIALNSCDISRQELFVTSKVWNDDQGYDHTLKAFDKSLKKLDLDYLDLYLIHWPIEPLFSETWRACIRLLNEKRVRKIGVANFEIQHLQVLEQQFNHYPCLNQIERHPFLLRQQLVNHCKAKDIVVQAWGPLGHGQIDHYQQMLAPIAQKYNKTIAQVLLRWQTQNGIAVIPKTSSPERLQENWDSFSFNLSQQDMQMLNSLNKEQHFGKTPEYFNHPDPSH